eukprot:sb/3476016/
MEVPTATPPQPATTSQHTTMPLVFDKRPAPPPVPVVPPPPQPEGGIPLKLRQPSPNTTYPTPFFSPTDTDIAAAIGSGYRNGDDKTSPATTTTRPDHWSRGKDPSLKESFMKFSGKETRRV